MIWRKSKQDLSVISSDTCDSTESCPRPITKGTITGKDMASVQSVQVPG